MSDVSEIDDEPVLARDHSLPTQFSGSSPTLALPEPPAARKRHPRVVFGTIAGVAVVATLAILQTTANLGYDAAADQYRDVAKTASQSKADLQRSTTNLHGTSGFAGQLLEHGDGALIDVAAKNVLTTSVAEATSAASGADSLLKKTIPVAGAKQTYFWELYGATQDLNDRRSALNRLDRELDTESTRVTRAGVSLTKAGTALLTTAATAAAPFEAAHISARNTDVLALRDAAKAASTTSVIDANAVTRFTTLQNAATQVLSSESAELAEKAGPLLNARLEVEAFARSLAPGVLIDFNWAQIVNGVGNNGSMGGYTTWWWADPGYATIELSNSVAGQWPSIRSKSLVAHEVGHAISVKCPKAYDTSTQDSIEKWATAWAISMGYTDDANGVWAYGYPPQSYIDAAATCR